MWPELFDPAVVEPAVSVLADLAGAGPALEFGIGTGRIALPLSRRGTAVHGIELSPAIVARLRAQPGGVGATPWPAEPDLMARLAGLRIRHRWADWHLAPFTDDSRNHISVWERP